jgi:elongation factor Tu
MVQGSLEATKPEITIGVLGQDVRSLLLAHGYSDDPIIHGSATAALNSLETGVFDLWTSKIRELLDTLDTTILAPQKIEDKPFLMSIEDVFSVPRTGTVVTGFVQRGTCRIGATVEVVGLGPTHATIATDLEQFHKKSYLLSPGNNAGVLLRGLNRADAQRGQFLAAPRTINGFVPCSIFRYREKMEAM